MEPKKPIPFYIYTFTLAVFLLVSGGVIFFAWPLIFDHILTSQLELKPDNSIFDIWKKVPFPLGMSFYFFNWTNPQDVYNNSVKFKFEEVGPYKFKETKEKVNITWNENGTVSFRHLKFWYMEDEEKLKDLITTLDPIAVTAAYVARDWNYFVKKALSVSINSLVPSLHTTRTAKEFLFEGYENSLINMARTMPMFSDNILPPWDRFGWFYTRNGSADYEGAFNMGTGDKTEFGKLYEWNHKTQTGFYPDPCGKVSGSAGELFMPHPPKTSISFFSSDLGRYVELDYAGEVTVNNILGYKYVGSDRLLDNGTKIPENKCFCVGDCMPSGSLNASAARFNSPSFASLPHFYNGDPYYTEAVEGLKPDQKKHEFFITLEPTTGIPLEVQARLQLNLLLQPISNIGLFQGVPKVYVPMLWFEQRVVLPDDIAFKLKFLLNMPTICSSLGIICISLGLILASCAVYKACTTNFCERRKKEKYMYTEQTIPLNKDRKMEIVRKA